MVGLVVFHLAAAGRRGRGGGDAMAVEAAVMRWQGGEASGEAEVGNEPRSRVCTTYIS
jgi:hypothetical protein